MSDALPLRQLGPLTVSAVGLGCNNFGRALDREASTAVVHAALDLGITLFDTADIYGGTDSEVFLGEALGRRRSEVVVATKFGEVPLSGGVRNASPPYVRAAVDASLQRLGTDWIDLYQLHFPDPATPIADTLGALNEAVQAGKVLHIGCSNFTQAMIREADAAATGARFVTVQNEYSLLERGPETDGVLEECCRLGLGFLPYFPLAGGLLTGKYRGGMPSGARWTVQSGQRRDQFVTERNFAVVEELWDWAVRKGRTMTELAFGWLLQRPEVSSVIAGATSSDQVAANVAAAGAGLTAEEIAELDAITAAR
ncbi:MAG: aldo/keto reductase [Bifidobacteriaceae bacterium]|jgi:aryl-alcohol dehydrogenase-like predicted oxidoreductase|nr:aldo/keto reductase [Bifidobacteriaceae bacterium]